MKSDQADFNHVIKCTTYKLLHKDYWTEEVNFKVQSLKKLKCENKSLKNVLAFLQH